MVHSGRMATAVMIKFYGIWQQGYRLTILVFNDEGTSYLSKTHHTFYTYSQTDQSGIHEPRIHLNLVQVTKYLYRLTAHLQL